jgi:hypothetical protein
MSGHDAKLAHRAPSVLANETPAGLHTRRIHRTARAPLKGQQVLLRPQRGDFTARISPRRTNVTLVPPRVNRTEALGEVLGIIGKVLRRSSPQRGRAPRLAWEGHLPQVSPRRRRGRPHGEDRDCQITDVPRFAGTAASLLGGFRLFWGFVLHESERAASMQTSVKGNIWRAIRAGGSPAQRKDEGGFEIDPADPSRIFEPQRPHERPLGDKTQRPPRRLPPPIDGLAGNGGRRGNVCVPYAVRARISSRRTDVTVDHSSVNRTAAPIEVLRWP